MPVSQFWKATSSIKEKEMQNSSGASTQPCYMHALTQYHRHYSVHAVKVNIIEPTAIENALIRSLVGKFIDLNPAQRSNIFKCL